MSKKKPTAMELKKVIEHLIVTMGNLELKLENLSYAFLDYINYKKDSKKFETYLVKKEKEYAKQKTS